MNQRINAGQRPLAAGIVAMRGWRKKGLGIGGVGLGDLPRWGGGTDTEN
jgi:hypothetical protein